MSKHFNLKPRIYLAGKIAQEGWRSDIARPSLGYDAEQALDPSYVVDCPQFLYGGPFYIGCKHACTMCPTRHGVMGCCGTDEDAEGRKKVYNANRERIRRSDFVFAYINEPDCFGTIGEVGIAAQCGIPIAVAFGPAVTGQLYLEMWTLRAAAFTSYRDLEAWEAWHAAFAQFERSRPRTVKAV